MEEKQNSAYETPEAEFAEPKETEANVTAGVNGGESPEAENIPVEEEKCEEEKLSGKEKRKAKKVEAELNELKKTLEKQAAEFADLNDKYLRLCAEYDNFRKRSAKEREGIYADACADALTKILPVLDNLERAAAYNTEEAEETPMGKGLSLTLKSFAESLAQLGVSEIEAEGKTFDPNLHNAVMHVEDESVGENQVVEVLMKGYIKGDKVLRYAMVKVAN